MNFEHEFGDHEDETKRGAGTDENRLDSRPVSRPPGGGTRADHQVWSDQGGLPRVVAFQRHDLDFEEAIDQEKIESLLAWNNG